MKTEGIALTFGINVIGYVSSNVSLGITARHFIRLFLDRGIPVSVHDLDYERAPHAKVHEFSSLTVPAASELPYSINLFFVAMWQLPELLLWPPNGLFSPSRINAGLLWYEPTHLARRYREALSCLDVLITGSDYVRYIYDTQVTSIFTIACNHPIYLPANIRPDRKRFNLPEKGVLFVQSFDPHNDPDRKNPYAAIDAFIAAFGVSKDDAHLVLKVNNAEVKSSGCDPNAVIEQLKARCGHDPRIHFIAESLPYEEVLSLYATCDVFISLHRAEGLGLGMLESMALGKPVIATAWSGNMSFMKHTNSCLVGYDLVPFSGLGADGPDKLRKHAVWAEPHIDEAADWMKRLAADASLRKLIGAQAARDAAAYHADATNGDFVEELRELYEQRRFIRRRQVPKWKNNSSLREAFDSYRQPGWRRMGSRIHQVLERHLMWRLRG